MRVRCKTSAESGSHTELGRRGTFVRGGVCGRPGVSYVCARPSTNAVPSAWAELRADGARLHLLALHTGKGSEARPGRAKGQTLPEVRWYPLPHPRSFLPLLLHSQHQQHVCSTPSTYSEPPQADQGPRIIRYGHIWLILAHLARGPQGSSKRSMSSRTGS